MSERNGQPQDGLYVKVGIPHSDQNSLKLSKAIRKIGVGWLIPTDKRKTHELYMEVRRMNYHPMCMAVYADLIPKDRSLRELADYYHKNIMFDLRQPCVGRRKNEWEWEFRPEFVADLLRELDERADWRKIGIFEQASHHTYYGDRAA